MAERVPITAHTLGAVRALAALTIEERNQLAEECKGFRYAKGDPIFFRQDPSMDVLFIASGRVGITLYSSSGRKTDLRDMSQGEMFGEMSAIDSKPRSADVVAREESVVVSVSAPVFRNMLRHYPVFMEYTLTHLTGLVRSLSERVFEYDTFPVPVRVRLELYRQGKNGGVIDPAPKHADIAARVGTHREAVSREFSRLTKSGVVRKDGRSLVIADLAGLLGSLEEGGETTVDM